MAEGAGAGPRAEAGAGCEGAVDIGNYKLSETDCLLAATLAKGRVQLKIQAY